MLTDMGEFMDQLVGPELVAARTAESYDVLDAAGMNYMEARYELDRELFPRRVIVGSETFPGKIDRLWRLVQDNPHVIGDFTWTGWDYLGEAGVGPGDVRRRPDRRAVRRLRTRGCSRMSATSTSPATAARRPTTGRSSSACAATRTSPSSAGAPRPRAVDDPVGVERHGRQLELGRRRGQPVTVEVYSDADEVELLLDGRSLGTAKAGEKNRFRAEFEVTYEPGELTAVARTGGAETGRFALRSATGPVVLHAVADRAGDPGRRHRSRLRGHHAAGRRRHRRPRRRP